MAKIRRHISTLTDDEKADIWLIIGGTPHLFNDHQMMEWMVKGEVPEGIIFGGLEIIMVGKYLLEHGFEGNFTKNPR